MIEITQEKCQERHDAVLQAVDKKVVAEIAVSETMPNQAAAR